jgi:hypothetical protein
VCETERFPSPEKNFSDGAWCMERLHDRPFQDFVAHETHRLIHMFQCFAYEKEAEIASKYAQVITCVS